jgi:hypothetical protein
VNDVHPDPLEDDLRRSLGHEAQTLPRPTRPAFHTIATRGRRRAHRRRNAAVAGVGVGVVLGSAVALRVAATDGDLEVATSPTTEPYALDLATVHGDPFLFWATEPVPAGCAAFAAEHPGAKGLRAPEIGEGPDLLAPYLSIVLDGTGPRLQEGDDESMGQFRRIVTGPEATVLYELDPGFVGSIGSGPLVAGGYAYFSVFEQPVFDPSTNEMPDPDPVIRRVPLGGGPVEDIGGNPRGMDFAVSPDGRYLAVNSLHTSAGRAMSIHDLETGSVHEIAVTGELAGGRTGQFRFEPDGSLILNVVGPSYMVSCDTGDAPTSGPGPDQLVTMAVDPEQSHTYRLDPDATSLDGAELIRVG